MSRVVESSTKSDTNKNSVLKKSMKNEAFSLRGRLKNEKKAVYTPKSSTSPRVAGNVSVNTNAKSSQVLELNLRRIDPISAAKFGFFVSIALGVMFVVIVSLFWILLDTSGVIYKFMEAMVGAGLGVKSNSGMLGVTKVALIASLIACVNVILTTIIAVVFSLIYNISASLSGGIKLVFGHD
ncbi:MAG: DUF3566 domain-containing protein [Candidatus Ancillula sp.]|jgi:hypothetical protein|nr:DUF3566 domain-containing protein [Candidatus Ancillula sp.]